MKIHIEKDIYVQQGFYCDGCYFKHDNDDATPPYMHDCAAFSTFLNIGKRGKVLKCEPCLLACRESLMEG